MHLLIITQDWHIFKNVTVFVFPNSYLYDLSSADQMKKKKSSPNNY